MSGSENFVARWSRLKRSTVKQPHNAEPSQPALQSADAAPIEALSPTAQEGSLQAGAPSKAPFDPDSLPPVDSITAESDIKAFLQSGVPQDLTRAALRRAWTADPAIRDFVGLAENQWDFTDPTAMPGFGPLEATDDIGRLVSQAMGKLGEPSELPEQISVASYSTGAPNNSGVAPPAAAAPLQTAGMPREIALQQRGDPEKSQHETVFTAAQQMEPAEKALEAHNRRAHGGALPK